MRHEIFLVLALLLAGGLWALLLRAACRNCCDGGAKPVHPVSCPRPSRKLADADQDLIDRLCEIEGR